MIHEPTIPHLNPNSPPREQPTFTSPITIQRNWFSKTRAYINSDIGQLNHMIPSNQGPHRSYSIILPSPILTETEQILPYHTSLTLSLEHAPPTSILAIMDNPVLNIPSLPRPITNDPKPTEQPPLTKHPPLDLTPPRPNNLPFTQTRLSTHQ